MPTRLHTSRRAAYGTLFLVWGLVAVYAVVHDQYVARLEPRHFTHYHQPVAGITSAADLAVIHALLASVGPGLLLGLGCLLASTAGRWPRLGRRFILRGVLTTLALTEASALASGLWVTRMQSSFFPRSWFPDQTHSMAVTQTIQLTTYLAGAVFSCGLLTTLVWRRFRLHAEVDPLEQGVVPSPEDATAAGLRRQIPFIPPPTGQANHS
jgi:hypothetical protein